jgi:transposase-like protein
MYRFTDKERYIQIKEDLENIQQIGIIIKAIICDGNKAILKAVGLACGEVTVQRCLVHIHRESNVWLRKKPVNQYSKELKGIVNLIFHIKTKNDKKAWIIKFNNWYELNKEHLNEKKKNLETGRWWYRHKNLRRSAVMIKKAIPNMFHFLDNPAIPKSTNNIESFFGHLKDTLSIHRGLSIKHRREFIQWYLHFKNQNRT